MYICVRAPSGREASVLCIPAPTPPAGRTQVRGVRRVRQRGHGHDDALGRGLGARAVQGRRGQGGALVTALASHRICLRWMPAGPVTTPCPLLLHNLRKHQIGPHPAGVVERGGAPGPQTHRLETSATP